MVSREDFEACGGFTCDSYPEDYDLCFRMYRENLKVLPVLRLLHWWRDYPDRTSRTSEWYAQNSFLELKIRYFLELDHNEDRSLVVWGAGWKGKQIARHLNERGHDFNWLCDNPRKWGKKIYGLDLEPLEQFDRLGSSQSIVAVANPDAQREIRAFFRQRELSPQRDFFFFC
jgi:FlaA1/EpsC-like NDP-sugar epimerase